MNIKEKLLNIQSELRAPKSQRNNFGKYNYRSCEDILEAVKPLCLKYKAVLTMDDSIVTSEGRFYICAEASLRDIDVDEGLDVICTHGYAREPDAQKGMSDSQITGTASSYAGKYALNKMFCIDDSKVEPSPDPDSQPPNVTAKDVKNFNINDKKPKDSAPKAEKPAKAGKKTAKQVQFIKHMGEAKATLFEHVGDDSVYKEALIGFGYEKRTEVPEDKMGVVFAAILAEVKECESLRKGL